MVATILGPMDYYAYQSANGKLYLMRQRVADAVAVGNSIGVRGTLPSLPRFLKPRHIWIQGPLGQRRRINVGTETNAKYLQGGTVGVDGIAWEVTGRVGEKDVGATRD